VSLLVQTRAKPPRHLADARARSGLFGRWEAILALILLAVCAGNAALSPYFLDLQNLLDSTQSFSEKSLIVLSMTLVMIGRDIDLSVASIVALCGTAMGWLAAQGVGMPGLLAASLLVGTAAGMFNGAIVTAFGIPAIVVTIGTVSLFRGISVVVLGDGAYTEFPEDFAELGQGYLFGLIPYEFIALLVAVAAFATLLHRTRIGRRLYAYGQNPDAARYSGINVKAHRFWFFSLNGAVSGLAAAFLTSRIGAARPNMALGWDLEVIAMAVLGGVSITGGSGSIGGVTLSIFVMGMLTFGLSLRNVPGISLNIVAGLLLIVAVALPTIVTKIAARRTRARVIERTSSA
jgi:rhamnose transport system permease protein